MREQEGEQRPGRVTIENVNHPGSTSTVDAGMYHAMRAALLKVLPTVAPGLTQAQMRDALVPHCPMTSSLGARRPAGGPRQCSSISRRRASSRGNPRSRCAGIAARNSERVADQALQGT